MVRLFTRRRAIAISAAAAGLELLPLRGPVAAHDRLTSWRGVVLGAPASLQIHHGDPAVARRLIELAVSEARRLEGIFSLYRPDSALVDLNRRGALAAPPGELVDLLQLCQRHHALTKGVFDPTVQVLWQLYSDHFANAGAGEGGPPQRVIDAALQRVGFGKVSVSRDRIVFVHRGMALTLNGIAQGYITDQVVALLRDHGIEHSLVDMGEIRAIGDRPDATPWKIGITGSDDSITLVDQAVATSAGGGYRFDALGRFNHLFDPSTGRSPPPDRSVTVVMPTATDADALSTAFSLVSEPQVRDIMRELSVGEVRFIPM
ncbi:FAD:protein FMN transferase [Reyranella sp.]|uniref:FAD:protein FMN transferase n=1 Tax=Reyranella sp. TaxID=1929291 RepID=UPI003783710F